MKGQRLLVFCVIVLGSSAAALLADRFGGLTRVDDLELKTLDWRQVARAENRQSGERQSEVVIVFFDKAATRDWPYLSPYPRTVLAELIEALSAAGARSIGVDVFLEELYADLNQMFGGNERLRTAMESAGNVILVAPTMETDSGRVLMMPHPYFAEVAADVGTADLLTPFETFRDGLLATRSGAGLESSFALALFAHARGLSADSILDAARNTGRIEIPGSPPTVIPLPEGWSGSGPVEGQDALAFPLRFVGPPSHEQIRTDGITLPGTFPAFSASTAAVMASFMPDIFRDRIVLLGSGFHDQDKFRTPFYEVPAAPDTLTAEARAYDWMFGVEIHANALQNLLDGQFVRRLGFGWTLAFLIVLGTAAGGLVFWKGAGWGAAAGGVAVLAVIAMAFGGFAGEISLPLVGRILEFEQPFLWVPIITPIGAVLVSYLASTAYVSIVEGREKRFIRGAFGKYVSPAVVEQISEQPEALRLGGQKRPLSVLFSDLAGFTDLSESMDAEDLITLLNDYLSEMTDLVLQEGGTLDKYIGDAIMAFWNAPQEQEDHADRALRCAVLMQRKMNELNERWAEEKEGAEPLTVRIGVNTGVVVVGNVGGKDRFDYSAIGDAVNLAARLEPANKTYGTLTMASEYTLREAVASNYQLRELDLIAVKGKTKPVRVYEVLELDDGELPKPKQEALAQFNLGLDAYHRRDWELAREYFAAAREADPTDEPSELYRCRACECCQNPPAEDWDFVVRRTTK